MRIPNKTVYVLGTGFSRPLGIPVITEFIPEGLRLLKKRSAKDPSCTQTLSDMQSVLFNYIPMLRLAEAEEREPTIEDVFCAVDLLGLSKGNTGSNDANKDSETVKDFLRKVCELPKLSDKCYRKADHDHLKCPRVDQVHLDLEGDVKWDFLFNKQPGDNKKHRDDDTVCAYFAFLSQILGNPKSEDWKLRSAWDVTSDKRADAIISFNYDLVIERKMEWICEKTNCPIRIYYGKDVVASSQNELKWLRNNNPTDHDLPLIKLHGSFNWTTEDKKTVLIDPSENLGSLNGHDPNQHRAGIVWPTWIREEFSGVFDKLLREAHEHLQLASKVVFIGYSMPLTDRYIRYLLADAFSTPELPEVVICDFKKKEEDIRHSWEHLLGTLAKRIKPTVFTGGFVEYVKQWKRPRMTDDETQ